MFSLPICNACHWRVSLWRRGHQERSLTRLQSVEAVLIVVQVVQHAMPSTRQKVTSLTAKPPQSITTIGTSKLTRLPRRSSWGSWPAPTAAARSTPAIRKGMSAIPNKSCASAARAWPGTARIDRRTSESRRCRQERGAKPSATAPGRLIVESLHQYPVRCSAVLQCKRALSSLTFCEYVPDVLVVFGRVISPHIGYALPLPNWSRPKHCVVWFV